MENKIIYKEDKIKFLKRLMQSNLINEYDKKIIEDMINDYKHAVITR